jgi:hypothetical protein
MDTSSVEALQVAQYLLIELHTLWRWFAVRFWLWFRFRCGFLTRLQHWHDERRAGKQGTQVEIRIVLAKQPKRHVISAVRQDPYRLTPLHDVLMGVADLKSGEERLLQSTMVGEPSLLEAFRAHVFKRQAQAPTHYHGLTVTHAIQATQAGGADFEPLCIMAERFGRLHFDCIIRRHGVIARIRRERGMGRSRQ